MDLFLKLFVDPEFQKILLEEIGEEGITEGSYWYVYMRFTQEENGMKSIDFKTAKNIHVNPFKFYYIN